ncbi:hypothetical protein GCM10022384_09570 [Streptomyces marokkonensis]|uniref:Uncharacterized protein n=1 Tax=Streptomyces marokkonensis TaxID=324855 RepID=A0ABP7P2T5_9ACTN
MHLYADAVAAGQEPHQEAPAGWYAVHQGVGRQFADAQHHIVRALMHTPLGECLPCEGPGGGNRPAFAAVEAFSWGRGLSFFVHVTRVTLRGHDETERTAVQRDRTGARR